MLSYLRDFITDITGDSNEQLKNQPCHSGMLSTANKIDCCVLYNIYYPVCLEYFSESI